MKCGAGPEFPINQFLKKAGSSLVRVKRQMVIGDENMSRRDREKLVFVDLTVWYDLFQSQLTLSLSR